MKKSVIIKVEEKSNNNVVKLASSNKSIQQLALTGFTLVALPLCIAVVLAFIKLDTLSQQGRSAVSSVAEVTKLTRLVEDTVYDLERYTRQFLILEDEKLLSLFDTRLSKAIASASELEGTVPEDMEALINRIRTNLNIVRRQLEQRENVDTKLILNEFEQINRFTAALVKLSYSQVNANMAEINRHASDTRMAIVQATAVIPISLITAMLFIYLIGRPLSSLKPQITKLEQGNFDDEISVSGAKDVVDIGRTLETMRQRLNYLENQKTRFIRQVSHELKTPLAAIKESADLLNTEVVGPLSSEQKEISTILLNGSERMQLLIEELIQFNLVLAKDKERKNLQLDEIVNAIEDSYRLALNERNVKVETQLSPTKFWFNEEHMRVILDNLISNAIKYSPQGGKVVILDSRSTSDLLVSVEDQGPGVPESIKEQIFEPFFHGPKPEYGKIKSNGLGLAICRELVKSYNGTITQTNLESGNRFVISFPLSAITNSENTHV